MKRIVTILLLFTFQLSAFTLKAQDLYQIEQSFDHDFKIDRLYIDKGWDARLIQVSEGAPTSVVITTPCAHFFEEGEEPDLFEVKKSGSHGYYYLKSNHWMPRTTVVEIYTSQPFKSIELYKGARLTIQHYDFDSVRLDISADTGAVLVVDTMNNHYSTSFTLSNATLDLRHFSGKYLHIHAYGESVVKEGSIGLHIEDGDVRAQRQWIHRGEKAVTDITATDSSRRVYVEYHKRLDREWKLHYLQLNFGFDLAMPVWVENSRYNSPYNTNFAFSGHIKMTSNDMAINRLLGWNIGLDVSWSMMQLDNAVKTDGSRLVLDPSYGATPPRQSLYYWSVGLPVTLKFNFGKWGNPYLGAPFRGLYLTLTPTLNFKPRLVTKSLDEDSHWNTDRERVDILNRFNVRAAVGLDCAIGGLGKVELFVDLLPSFRSSADAPQTRMFGLSYIF